MGFNVGDAFIKINQYFHDLTQDKQFAWLAIIIGILLIILALIIW